MVEPNAILAINSLDRFITNQYLRPYIFYATWANNSTSLTYLPPPQSDYVPLVGSYAFANGTGIPTFTKITAFNPITNIITIDQATTQASALATETAWGIYMRENFTNDSLRTLYNNSETNISLVPLYGNNFTLQSLTAYIYGYMYKMIVSQIQVQYNVPTVNLDLNDKIYLLDDSPGGQEYPIQIPYGFYTPDELAAVLQVTIRALTPFTTMTVSYENSNFVFTAAVPYFQPFSFASDLTMQLDLDLSQEEIKTVLKTYRLLGITVENSDENTTQESSITPNFMYTSYIDIYSDSLTNYQKIKDTDTSIKNAKGLVARVYLSGVGNPQTTTGTSALGSAPFIMTADLNSPKVIRWTPDVTVTSIDIQVRDQYGDLLPGYDKGFNTEFQMTLLCVEHDQ